MRRAPRIALWTLGSALLLVVLLTGALLVAGNTEGGRALIERSVARLSAGQVRVAGLSGSFPRAIGIAQLQLRDTRGVWLTAQQVSLRWSPLALLTRHVQIEELRLASLDIERRPIPRSPSAQGGGSAPPIDLARLSIDRLELGPELTGTRVSLAVQGSVHYRSSTEASAELSVRRSDGQGTYQLSARLDAQRADARVNAQEPPNGPLENLLGLPGLGALAVQATIGGPRNAERLGVDVRAGDLHATAHGTLDLPGQSADLNYDLEAPAMSPRPGIAWQQALVRGSWHGPLRSSRADARVELRELEVPGGLAARTVDAHLTADAGTVALSGEIDGLTMPGSTPRLLAQSPLHIVASAQLGAAERPAQLEVRHSLFTLQARAATAGAAHGTFNLRLPDLAPLAAIAGQKIAGRSEVTGVIRQDGDTTRFEGQANSELTGAPSALAALLGGSSRADLKGELSASALTIERFSLAAPKLALSASGNAAREPAGSAAALSALHAKFTGRLADVTAFSPSVNGPVAATGSIDGPVRALQAAVRVTANLSVSGGPRETLEARMSARGLPALQSAALEAHGRLQGAPLELAAVLERSAGDGFHVQIHRAEWKSAHLDGDLTSAADLATGQGALHLTVGSLADLQALAGESLGGSVEATVALQARRGRTYAQARLTTHDLVVAGVPASVLFTADGPSNGLALHLSARSPALRGEPAAVDAVSRLNLGAHTLALEHVQAHYHGQTLQLLAPARVSFGEGVATSELKLGMQHAVMTLEGRLSPVLEARASVHQVDAALINSFLPGTLAQGSLDAEAHLQGQPAALSGTVSANATGLRFADAAARGLPAVDVHAKGQLASGAMRVNGQLTAGDSSRLALEGTAPLGGGASPVNLKLTGELDARLANALLEAQGRRAAGTLAVDVNVSGPASAPELSGTVDLTHGELRDYVQGVHLSEVTAHLVGQQGTLRIERFTARAPPGDVSMTGTIGVLQPKMPVDLELVAKNAQPITSTLITTNLDADLKLTGTLRERVQLAGSIDLHRTMIGVPNSLPPDVAVLDVRRPGAAPPATAHALVIGLDVRMHAPRQILVQGRGLNAELGGDLHVTGSSDQPHVGGGFQLIRGTFALSSSTLTFTKGEVSFNGAGLKKRIDPTLDFTAESTAADATATLHVTGFADAPRFELSSSPSLPQDEILARLLFGESAAQLTPLQLAQIGAALASLGGVGGGGTNPLVKVQKALGLDRLSVGSGSGGGAGGQSSGTSVEAGRYVSSRVFVGARQSTTGFSQVEVAVDLTKHLKLQTRLGNGTATTQGTTPENDPGSSIGLAYQFEY